MSEPVPLTMSSEIARTGAAHDASFAQATSGQLLRRGAIALAVALYLGAILIGPLAALVVELGRVGIGAALRSLTAPDAVFALRTTLVLTTIAVIVNAVVGTLGAIAVVRHSFRGRALVNALADLPLAVSPVMIGLAFILLFGREGWFAALIHAAGIEVVFAWTGLLIATLF
ncbi:MAG TPA: hypothetical protein VHM19_12250, partial [Polyangiales bacterium]|nr:hypothetical protein [Polyangiales bacterium]